MIRIVVSPGELFIVLGVVFLAAYGAAMLSITILRGAWTVFELGKPDPAPEPAAARPAYSVFGSTDYHRLVEPVAPTITPPAPWNLGGGWVGEPTAWCPTIRDEMDDDTEVPPPPQPRARTRFSDLLTGPALSAAAADVSAPTELSDVAKHPDWVAGRPDWLEGLREVAWHQVDSCWGGVPGECGASCVCGLSYDGFGTMKAAGDLIDRHIEQANAGLTPPEGVEVAAAAPAAAAVVVTIHDPSGRLDDARIPVGAKP